MPDWIVHIAVAYIICRILYFKYPVFNSANTVLAMLGALLPDIAKIGMVAQFYSIYLDDYLFSFHTPLASLVLAGLLSIFFKEKKLAFLFLGLGIFTHFALDLLLIRVGEGYYLLFPISWQTFHLDLIAPDDYNITLVVLLAALVLYSLGRLSQRRSEKS
ncbi:MAG: hypothetical protein Q8N08_00970 [Methanobacteriaceae archaeon]|nr:hypothetical protein [Methanobacteriaceae archaeon]